VAGLGNGGSMSASPTTATMSAGQSAKFTVTITANAASAGQTLTLSCASLPPGLSCAFTPATVTLGAAGTTTSATLTITRLTTAALQPPASWLFSASTWALMLPAIVLIGLRAPRGRRGALLLLAFIVVSAGISSSCGGGGMSNVKTPEPAPQGSYTVIVVGNAPASHTSTTVNVTVQ
jgi:hypothetical protein